MKDKIIGTIFPHVIRAFTTVAVTQGSKYLTRPLVLPEESFEKVNRFIDRVDEEIRPFEGIDLDKPMTVIRASAKFAKSKIARQQKRKVRVERVDMSLVHEAVRIAVNTWMGSKGHDNPSGHDNPKGYEGATWENYAECYNQYVRHVVKHHGDLLVEDKAGSSGTGSDSGSGSSKKGVGLQAQATQIMSIRQDLHMTSPPQVLDSSDNKNILMKHILVQKELTVIAQVQVKESVLHQLLLNAVPSLQNIELGHYAIFTLYGAYAPTGLNKRQGLTYEDIKDYVSFIVVEIHKSLGVESESGTKKDTTAHSTFLMSTLYDIRTGGKSGLDERNLLFIPSTYVEEGGKVDLLGKLRDMYWQHSGNIAEVINEQDKPWIATGRAHQFVHVAAYHGDEKDLWEDWEAYMAAGTPNTVLLWGRPGCGKTTLIREGLARLSREGKRCLYMDNAIYKSMSNVAWGLLVEKYRPDILWVDDIDRVDRSDLSMSLARIDRNHYKVPLTIFTSNSLKRIPPAFYRTDRIDYIYQIEISDESLKLMMRALLTREGVDAGSLSPDQFSELLKLSENGTASDMLKYIRRGKILGWDRMTCPHDQGIRVMSDED